jgi:hypothetical protein
MSQQLHSAMVAILEMPYYKNDNRRSGSSKDGHEEAVAIRIKDAGFTEVPKDKFPKITKSMLKRFAKTGDDAELRKATQGLSPGSYILQPSGSQGFPDILVLDFTDVFVNIECKSAKGSCPMWNDSLPHPTSIYVLACGNLNETTIFMGRDVITPEQLELRDQFVEELKQVIAKYKEIMTPHDMLERGWLLKARQQFFQEGGKTKTNYFTHSKRKGCELLALEYAKQ